MLMLKHVYTLKFKPEFGLILALLIFVPGFSACAQGQAISDLRQKELKHLLVQDCGSCHGLTLEGGLGPPLLAAEMAEKSKEWLRQVILDGIPDTAMPPWRPFMNEVEADWLVNILQQGLSNE